MVTSGFKKTVINFVDKNYEEKCSSTTTLLSLKKDLDAKNYDVMYVSLSLSRQDRTKL